MVDGSCFLRHLLGVVVVDGGGSGTGVVDGVGVSVGVGVGVGVGIHVDVDVCGECIHVGMDIGIRRRY